MTRPQLKGVFKAMVPLLVLALSAGALSACSNSNSDTASTEATAEGTPALTEATAEETPTPTAADEPAALTAETTGNLSAEAPLTIETDPETGLNVAGEPTGEMLYQIEVTLDDGSVRSFPTDEETLKLIWPDGTTAAGVLVVIEEVDGEQRITGPAD